MSVETVDAEESGSAVERGLNAVNLYLKSIIFSGTSSGAITIDKSGASNSLE